jgi:predicted phage terminase large subunit-like protein
MSVEPYLSAGNIFIPEVQEAPWVDKFILECAQFPHGKHDDAVDTMTQAINYMARHGQEMSDISESLLSAFGR